MCVGRGKPADFFRKKRWGRVVDFSSPTLSFLTLDSLKISFIHFKHDTTTVILYGHTKINILYII